MRWAVVVLVVTGTILGAVLGTPGPAEPAPSPPEGSVDPLDHEACVSCHPAQAEQWRGSPHQTSFSEATFQAAYALEPRAYCRDCHAPEREGSGSRRASSEALGIACASCHVHEGTILAAPASGSDEPAEVPHPLRRTSALSSGTACAGCHEFPFPDGRLRDRPLDMQRTVTEHAASRFSERSCVDCHMPRGDEGRRSHAFVASRDPVLVRSAVRISAERVGPTSLRVTLRPGEVGHAFPTGDLLRRLEVGAVATGAGEEARVVRRFLARHFGDRVQRSGARLRDELHDDRVPPDGPRVVDLSVPASEGRPIRWWVEYQRVAHQRTFDEADAVLDGRISLAHGTILAE